MNGQGSKRKRKYLFRRLLGFVFVGLYLIIALLNTTVFQSYLGAAASAYFSKEWGGKVRIGALHFSPISHVILDKIELISPTNDTIYMGDRISCSFKRFPFHSGHLDFDRVRLRNGRFHFASYRYPSGKSGINLDYIINYFAPKEPRPHKEPSAPFEVTVGELRLRNVDYAMDLPEHSDSPQHQYGVEIPHMRFIGTTAHFRKVRVINDSIAARIISFSTTEISGQHVVDLSADVMVSPHVIRATNLDLQTDDSRLFADAEMRFRGWKSMGDYCNNVMHSLVLKEGTEVNIRDAAFWAPVLWGVNCKFALQGRAYGPIADLHADNLQVAFGDTSSFQVNAAIKGLPQIHDTYIDANIQQFHTTYDDLMAVQHPERIKIILPGMLKQMESIDIDAAIRGGLSNCEANFAINSLIGDLEGQAQLFYDTTQHDFTYVGDLDSRSIGIRAIIPNEWVSRTGLHINFQGVGFDPQTMEASLEGRLYNTQFKNRNLDRTTISADLSHQILSADIQLKDSLIGLNLDASANLADQSYSADLYISDAHLTDLNLIQADSAIRISTHLNANVQGTKLEDLIGNLSLANTQLHLGQRHVLMNNLTVSSEEKGGYKDLSLDCDWMTLGIRGYLQYTDISLLIRDFCDRYLPTYYNPFLHKDSVDMTSLYQDNFDIDFVWNDENNSFSQILPSLDIAQGTTFHGSYNYGEALKMVFRSNQLKYKNILLSDVGFNSSTLGDNYQFRIHAANLSLNDNPLMENLHITAGMSQQISTLGLKWDDNDKQELNEGNLEFFLASSSSDNKLMITRPSFYAMGQQWTLICPQGILFNNERLKIDNLKIYGLGQSVTIKALMAGKEDDFVKAAFDDLVLDRICSILIPEKILSVQGSLDGLFSVKGLHDVTHFDADLVIEDCNINGQPAGEVRVNSNYKLEERTLYLDLVSLHEGDGHSHRPLDVHGSVLMTPGDPSLDMHATFDHVALETLGPAVSAISSRINGNLSGQLIAHGTLSNPSFNGSLILNDGLMQLTPTGVTYYFNDGFTIANNTLRLDGFSIRDRMDNLLTADGSVSLSGGNVILDLNIFSPRILALDKSYSTDANFYGKLIASVQGTIRGSIDDINISANASTLSGSELFVPLDNKKQVSENEYITFVSPAYSPRPATTTNRLQSSASALDLLLNLHVTPGMKIHLPMDFDQLGANVTAVGRGDVQLTLDANGTPNILGDYEFTSGQFSLSLMQLLSRNFTIEEGSTLNFPGDINDARFNINAVYNLRANLASLMNNSVATTTNDSYVQVQNVIKLAGTMTDPTIKFDIRLPNAEQSVTEQVFSYIDRNSERDMLNQSLSLLILGQFASAGTSVDNPAEGINSVGILANTAGNILTSMVKVVDVDVKYQAATSSAQGQVDVGISKRWNKFYFESTFGYGTTTDQMDINQNNTLVGDVEIGYKMNPYFNFYGFHRTNTSYYTRTELPYKQGVGVKLTKDFDSFLDLIPWIRKKE